MFLAPIAMHIPDGFLSVLVSVVFWVISIAVIIIALRKVKGTLGERDIPVMGVLAAAVFAGQMLNFTVAGGTSGHLLGAALTTIVLGPWAAVLVMTSVVSIQALIFQDGGILALGANLFNMAILGVAVSYAVQTLLTRLTGAKRWGMFISAFVSGWTSIFIASLCAALQLSASGTSPANISIPAMGGIHTLIGIGEGLITLGAVSFLYAARRDLLKASGTSTRGSRGILVGGFVIALALAIASPLASSHPDGLEWVAEQNGFLDAAQGSLYNIIPDYALPGLQNEAAATIIAGIIGILLVFGVAIAIAYTRRKRGTSQV